MWATRQPVGYGEVEPILRGFSLIELVLVFAVAKLSLAGGPEAADGRARWRES